MKQLFTILLIMILTIEIFGQSQKFEKSMTDLEWIKIKDKIYPILKGPVNATTSELSVKSKPVFVSYLADIQIAYLVDLDSFFTYVTQSQLLKWKIDKDSLRKTAQINLDNLSAERAEVHGDSTFAMITLDGNLEASLMLSDVFWPYISKILKTSDIVIGIPARDVLLVTSLASKEGLKKLRFEVNQIYKKDDHTITKWTFRRDNNKWIKFEQID